MSELTPKKIAHEVRDPDKFATLPEGEVPTSLSDRWQRCCWQQACGIVQSWYSNDHNKPGASRRQRNRRRGRTRAATRRVETGAGEREGEMSRYGIHDYRSHYVCFTCRRSVKLEYRRVRATCAQCGASLVPMGRDFHAPRREATNQWRKLRLLVLAGVTFDSCGCDGPGSRPRTLGEARRFVTAARARLDPCPAFARRATTC